MNRLRIRVGERVKEYVLRPPDEQVLLYVEDQIDYYLDIDFHFGPYQLEALGEFAYDILVDGQKVGHCKAWKEQPKPDKPTEPTLWQWLLLIVAAYGALL